MIKFISGRTMGIKFQMKIGRNLKTSVGLLTAKPTLGRGSYDRLAHCLAFRFRGRTHWEGVRVKKLRKTFGTFHNEMTDETFIDCDEVATSLAKNWGDIPSYLSNQRAMEIHALAKSYKALQDELAREIRKGKVIE